MPIIHVFPTNLHGFDVGEKSLSAWSGGGFSYRTGCGRGYDIFLGHSVMLGKDVGLASAPILGSVVVSLDGYFVAPDIIEKNKFEEAMRCYLKLFPEKGFDSESNDVLFFPDAVNIVDTEDYDYEGDNYAFHYSIDSGEVEDIKSKNIGVYRIFPSGVCVHEAPRGNRFVAIDSRLNELWAIERKHLDSAFCPVNITEGPVADTVLLNLGYLDVKDANGIDNDVALLEQVSGKCLWKVTFPQVVNSIWSDEKYVYVSSQGSAYLLDPENGDIVKRLENVFGVESNQRYQQNKIYQSVLKSSLVSDGSHLYFFNVSYLLDSSIDCKEFWIFDLATLECLRHEDFPIGYAVDKNLEPRFSEGKLYVPMTSSFWGNEGGALVEFNPDDIHSDFVCDVEVSFVESLRRNGGSEEYVLTTDCPCLDDILRYGESELKNLAIARGRCVFSKEIKNPAFNGLIHLAIRRDSLQPQPDAKDKLAILMQRLNAWGESGYYASDGKTFVSFDWEWV